MANQNLEEEAEENGPSSFYNAIYYTRYNPFRSCCRALFILLLLLFLYKVVRKFKKILHSKIVNLKCTVYNV